jgi:hypothetical protein
MAREMIEFECNDCKGFFPLNLNLGLGGDFMIECPNCHRMHPRKLEMGELVGMASVEALVYRDGVGKRMKRNNREKADLDVITAPKSTYSKESRLAKMKTASQGEFAKQSLLSRFFGKGANAR